MLHFRIHFNNRFIIVFDTKEEKRFPIEAILPVTCV